VTAKPKRAAADKVKNLVLLLSIICEHQQCGSQEARQRAENGNELTPSTAPVELCLACHGVTLAFATFLFEEPQNVLFVAPVTNAGKLGTRDRLNHSVQLVFGFRLTEHKAVIIGFVELEHVRCQRPRQIAAGAASLFHIKWAVSI
jgi:hypothetical protein